MQLPQLPFSLIVFLIVLMSIMLILSSIVTANAHAFQIARAEWRCSEKRLEVSAAFCLDGVSQRFPEGHQVTCSDCYTNEL